MGATARRSAPATWTPSPTSSASLACFAPAAIRRRTSPPLCTATGCASSGKHGVTGEHKDAKSTKMSERLPPAAEPEDHLGMTDEQWAWFQTCTHGYGEQDENGIDVSLLRENLRLTPTQRVEKLLQALPLDPRCQVVASKRSFRDLLAPLHAHNVSYVLMGVFAMACHGSAYVADHIDLACACEPNSLAALAEALALLHPRVRGAPEALPF